MKLIFALLLTCLAITTSSCIGIGYSSRGGWFIWPGGLGLLVFIIVLFLLFRRR